MKNVVKDGLKKGAKIEEVIDEKVKECFYSICRYYKKNIKTLKKYKDTLPKNYPNK